mgnify:CR=1 FL=1
MIINLTQHIATPEQVEAGVIDLQGEDLTQLKKLLNFVGMPTNGDIHDRAFDIARIADQSGAEAAMIGGAPYLMPHLQKALQARGIAVFYAFSERVSVERVVDGVVVKTNEFKHVGFVEVTIV